MKKEERYAQVLQELITTNASTEAFVALYELTFGEKPNKIVIETFEDRKKIYTQEQEDTDDDSYISYDDDSYEDSYISDDDDDSYSYDNDNDDN